MSDQQPKADSALGSEGNQDGFLNHSNLETFI